MIRVYITGGSSIRVGRTGRSRKRVRRAGGEEHEESMGFPEAG
jgi:hypothetical protein